MNTRICVVWPNGGTPPLVLEIQVQDIALLLCSIYAM
jgi:hypothetical protein